VASLNDKYTIRSVLDHPVHVVDDGSVSVVFLNGPRRMPMSKKGVTAPTVRSPPAPIRRSSDSNPSNKNVYDGKGNGTFSSGSFSSGSLSSGSPSSGEERAGASSPPLPPAKPGRQERFGALPYGPNDGGSLDIFSLRELVCGCDPDAPDLLPPAAADGGDYNDDDDDADADRVISCGVPTLPAHVLWCTCDDGFADVVAEVDDNDDNDDNDDDDDESALRHTTSLGRYA